MALPNGFNERRRSETDLSALLELNDQIQEQVMGKAVHTANKLSEITGWSLRDLDSILLWSAMPSVEPNRAAYTAFDYAALIQLRQAVARERMSKAELGSVIRSISHAMERLASTEVKAW